MKHLIFGLSLFAFSFQIAAQGQPSRVHLTELLEKAIASDKDTVRFENLIITNDNLGDEQTAFSYLNEKYPDLLKDSVGIVLPRMEFLQVSGSIELHHFSFPRGLQIGDPSSSNPYRDAEQVSTYLEKCYIKDLQLNLSLLGGMHTIASSKLEGFVDLKFKESERIMFVGNDLKVEGAEILSQQCNTLEFMWNTIESDEGGAIFLFLDDLNDVSIWYNEFDIYTGFEGYLSGRNISKLTIQRNLFKENLGLALANVTDQFTFINNELHKKVHFSQFVLPELYVKMDWQQFSGNRIYVKVAQSQEEDPEGWACSACLPYYGNSDQELSRTDRFNELVAVYARLHTIFKSNGDIIGANGSYAELQQLYTSLYGYKWRTEGGMKGWFRWRLNQLLDFYMNYGTDPAKALIVTFYILLAFALIYIIYPSEWDVAIKKEWITALKGLANRERPNTVRAFGKVVFLSGLNVVNAFTLSINSFVTLGFGAIPTTGISRYLCVLQGFIGWFLLSLFTVAIINQVIF